MDAFQADAIAGREGAVRGDQAVQLASTLSQLFALIYLGTNMSDDRVETIGVWLVANRYSGFRARADFDPIKTTLVDGSVTSKSGQITAAINDEVESVLTDEESRTFMLPTTVGGTVKIDVGVVALSETDDGDPVYQVASANRVFVERDGINYRRAYDHDNYEVYNRERLSAEGPNTIDRTSDQD